VKIERKRVLVTGGAGFIGSHLVERLALTNVVTVVDDFSVGTMENLAAIEPAPRVMRVDITDRSAVEAAVGDSQVIFHLAVSCLRVSISDPMRSHLVNDLGTLNLLLAAQAASVERFVHISSSEVYGTAQRVPVSENHPIDPRTPYAASKAAAETYALSFHRTYGFPVIVVRPFNTYGPRAHLDGPSGEVIPKFVARAMANQPLNVFGDGLQTRDFTWIGDVVRGIVLAAECDDLVGQPINIAHGEEVSILALAQLVQALVGRRVPINHLPDRPGDVRRHLAGVSYARQRLGFIAEVGIDDGLWRYVRWVESLPGDPLSRLRHEQVVNWQAIPQHA
jgi:UDP-glucose 4-epimerase